MLKSAKTYCPETILQIRNISPLQFTFKEIVAIPIGQMGKLKTEKRLKNLLMAKQVNGTKAFLCISLPMYTALPVKTHSTICQASPLNDLNKLKNNSSPKAYEACDCGGNTMLLSQHCRRVREKCSFHDWVSPLCAVSGW